MKSREKYKIFIKISCITKNKQYKEFNMNFSYMKFIDIKPI